MDPASFSFAVMGFFGHFLQSSLAAYNIYTDVQSFGKDYAHIHWEMQTEKLALERWSRKWNVLNSSNSIDAKSQRHAIITLAKIAAVFADINNSSPKYGFKHDGLSKLLSSFSVGRPNPQVLRVLVDDLSMTLILENAEASPAILEATVQQLERGAKECQKLISRAQKLKWAISDKKKCQELIVRLRRYNKALYRVLPEGLVQSPETKFELFVIPMRLPFYRNPKFCGRAELLGNIEMTLDHGSTDTRPCSRRTVVLHGLGGVGKSQVALEYAFRNAACYSAVFWIDASSSIALRQSAVDMAQNIVDHWRVQAFANGQTPNFTWIAKQLGLVGLVDDSGRVVPTDDKEQIRVLAAFKDWLSKASGEWLLCVDNLDDYTSVRIDTILPTRDSGAVIFTTRRPEMCSWGTAFEVDDMDGEDGLGLLLCSAGKKGADLNDAETQAAKDLAREVGYLPLALNQVGSYIARQRISFARYFCLYDFNRMASKTIPETIPGRREVTVMTVWDISFRQLPVLAQDILRICGYLDNQDIPDQIFYSHPDFMRHTKENSSDAHKQVEDALEGLFSFSLAKRKTSDNSFYVHPLVHAWSRESTEVHRQSEVLEKAVHLIGSVYVYPHDKRPEHWAFERRIAAHLVSLYPRLERCNQQIFESGAEKEWFLKDLRHLALMYEQNGCYDRAIYLCNQALDVYENKLRPNHPDTLTCLSNLSWMLRCRGKYIKSEELTRRALDGREKELGSDHPDTLTTMNGLAVVLQDQGKSEQAEETIRRAIKGKESSKQLGPDHPNTLISISNLGWILQEQGKYEEAEKIYQRVLEGRKKELGPEHPFTLRSMSKLALVLQLQGNYEMAEEWIRLALRGREKVLGPDHPDTLSSISDHALILHGRGKHEQAEEMLRGVLKGRESALGLDHPETLSCAKHLSMILLVQSKYEEAEQMKRANSSQ